MNHLQHLQQAQGSPVPQYWGLVHRPLLSGQTRKDEHPDRPNETPGTCQCWGSLQLLETQSSDFGVLLITGTANTHLRGNPSQKVPSWGSLRLVSPPQAQPEYLH